ncbi:MAG: hypothetical protein ACK5NN_01065 [Sphingomonadaceae bacterium]
MPLGIFAGAVQAFASDTSAGNSDQSLNLVINGAITARCSVGGGGEIDLGQMTGREAASARFDLACNVPFDLIATSASGGIAHEVKPEGEGPYKGMVPYRLGIELAGSAPQAVQLRGDFTSGEMVGGAVLSSGDAIAIGGGRIQLQGELPSGQELLAGRYRDSITIAINPRV